MVEAVSNKLIKALDTVRKSVLLNKPHKYGIYEIEHECIGNYLVHLEGFISFYQAYHRNKFWDNYCSYCILMTSRNISLTAEFSCKQMAQSSMSHTKIRQKPNNSWKRT